MATFYVTHHKFPDSPQLFTINISRVVKIEGEPNTDFSRDHLGEEFWEIYVATSGLDSEGKEIPPKWVDVKTTEATVDELVSGAVKYLCSLIDWTNEGTVSPGQDRFVPFIESKYPEENQANVPIQSTIKLSVRELLPGSGIDKNTISLKVKGVPVTPTVTGNPYGYVISYTPKPLL